MRTSFKNRLKKIEDINNPETKVHIIQIRHDASEKERETAEQNYCAEIGTVIAGNDLVVFIKKFAWEGEGQAEARGIDCETSLETYQ